MKTAKKSESEIMREYLAPIIIEKSELYGADKHKANPQTHPFAWCVEVAKSEVGYEFRKGDHAGMTYWVAGVALPTLPIYYGEIDETIKRLGVRATSGKWFEFVARHILLAEKEGK